MKKHLLVTVLLPALALPGALMAEEVTRHKEEQHVVPDANHTLTGNVGIFSQYVFRGLTQTAEDPALQGGFDYAHSSGFYAGTWLSNISWLEDFNLYTTSSLEWDAYGGYKGVFGASDFSYDVGFLYYYYPGDKAPGVISANTKELYGALGYRWLSAKYSYSIDDTFGIADSDGSWYLDLSANVPLGDSGFTAIAHWGKQEYEGSVAGVSNDALSYKDWKLGVNYALPKDFTISAYFTDTDAKRALYTDANGKYVGDSQFTVSIQKTF